MKIKKQILSDAIIAWMRYKRNVIKVPAYCTHEIEACIERWSRETLERVVSNIEVGLDLFVSFSCPFCLAYGCKTKLLISCPKCEFGKINGVCDYSYDNLWGIHMSHAIPSTPANRKRFNLIFNKLKKEL